MATLTTSALHRDRYERARGALHKYTARAYNAQDPNTRLFLVSVANPGVLVRFVRRPGLCRETLRFLRISP